MSAFIKTAADVTGPNGEVADGDLAVFNGTSGKVIRSISKVDAVPASSVVQTLFSYTGIPVSSAAVFPTDNTIPQSNEGAASGIQVVITPKYQNSVFLIVLSGTIAHSNSTAASVAVALFRSGLSDAIGTQMITPNASNAPLPISLAVPDVPNTLSPITYSLRYGGFGAGTYTVYLGRRTDALYLGGTQLFGITVYEIKQ